MTQKQFAEEYNIRGGNSAISKIENAKRSISADLLSIIAEDGNITVEQFYRDDVIVKIYFYFADAAMENIGSTKLFDLLFTVIRTASMKGNIKGIMMDEINVIDWSDYENNKSSRYINYLKEMISTTSNE